MSCFASFRGMGVLAMLRVFKQVLHCLESGIWMFTYAVYTFLYDIGLAGDYANVRRYQQIC